MTTPDNADLAIAVEEAKKEVSDYVETVHALCALVALTIGSGGATMPDGKYSFGRRMHTSPQNRVTQESREVTPDVVIQQSEQLGYVGEAKASLPQRTDYWRTRAKQLFKYDDDLRGWWTENERIPVSDLICLIGAPHTTRFADSVEQYGQQSAWTFNSKQCFLEISYTREGECLYLKLERGDLTDPQILRAVYEGREFSREDLIVDFGGAKFCDAPPPPEFVMEILWQDVFTRKKSTENVERDGSLGYWPLNVSLADLTDLLKKEYGSGATGEREVVYPRQGWVRGALDALTRIDLAKYEDGDSYLIKFRQLRGELIERFAKQRLEAPPSGEQPRLPGL